MTIFNGDRGHHPERNNQRCVVVSTPPGADPRTVRFDDGFQMSAYSDELHEDADLGTCDAGHYYGGELHPCRSTCIQWVRTRGQIRCPPMLRARAEPLRVNRESKPPGAGVSGMSTPLVCDMAVGDKGWVAAGSLFHDARWMVWVRGDMIVSPKPWQTAPYDVEIERTEIGVRVVTWEPGRLCELRPNRMGLEDVWVVELPLQVGLVRRDEGP